VAFTSGLHVTEQADVTFYIYCRITLRWSERKVTTTRYRTSYAMWRPLPAHVKKDVNQKGRDNSGDNFGNVSHSAVNVSHEENESTEYILSASPISVRNNLSYAKWRPLLKSWFLFDNLMTRKHQKVYKRHLMISNLKIRIPFINLPDHLNILTSALFN